MLHCVKCIWNKVFNIFKRTRVLIFPQVKLNLQEDLSIGKITCCCFNVLTGSRAINCSTMSSSIFHVSVNQVSGEFVEKGRLRTSAWIEIRDVTGHMCSIFCTQWLRCPRFCLFFKAAFDVNYLLCTQCFFGNLTL